MASFSNCLASLLCLFLAAAGLSDALCSELALAGSLLSAAGFSGTLCSESTLTASLLPAAVGPFSLFSAADVVLASGGAAAGSLCTAATALALGILEACWFPPLLAVAVGSCSLAWAGLIAASALFASRALRSSSGVGPAETLRGIWHLPPAQPRAQVS